MRTRPTGGGGGWEEELKDEGYGGSEKSPPYSPSMMKTGRSGCERASFAVSFGVSGA